ncbi:MAG: zinc ribbon domain-containing protein [Bacilli bacterium]|nr:zinc ribbon domain-containing protein [Bacilli bacterium]
MYCGNCGKENDNTSKFCENCGKNIERKEIIQDNNIVDNKKIGSTTLSILSLVFCIVQVVSIFITNTFDGLDFLTSIPWIIVSLVLAIISRCKYKDTMSLVMIIIDSVLIVLMIIGAIILFWLFISLFEVLLTGCNQLS